MEESILMSMKWSFFIGLLRVLRAGEVISTSTPHGDPCLTFSCFFLLEGGFLSLLPNSGVRNWLTFFEELLPLLFEDFDDLDVIDFKLWSRERTPRCFALALASEIVGLSPYVRVRSESCLESVTFAFWLVTTE